MMMAPPISHYINTVRKMTRDEIGALITPAFDANYYLDANPDVRAADWPALDHYLQHGWLEGRLPSEHFAACAAMFDLADLQSQRVDPFALFVLLRAGSLPADRAAANTDPLTSYRLSGYANYAGTLTGGTDWSGIAVEAPHHSRLRWMAGRLRWMAGRLRESLNGYAKRALILLPDAPWAGAAEIARILAEQHAAFVHFGEAAGQIDWPSTLPQIVSVSPSDAGSAAQLLIDIVQGIDPPLLVDMGTTAFGVATTYYGAQLSQRSCHFVTIFPQSGDPGRLEPVDWIVRVEVSAEGGMVINDSVNGPARIIPPASSAERLRDLVHEITAHAV